MFELPNVVLVHGAWADGSSWADVVVRLQSRGYVVTAPQFSQLSLTEDVAKLRQILRRQSGPTVLAAHSHGGQIITALGKDAENVSALVYIAAIGLDEGERLGVVLEAAPPTRALAHLIVDEQRVAWLPQEDYVTHFAAGVDPVKARVMCASQQGLSIDTLYDVMGVPAWRSHRSWYLVASEDEVIPPQLQRTFASRLAATTIEVTAGHLPMISHPDEVANLIRSAAGAVESALHATTTPDRSAAGNVPQPKITVT